MLAASRPDGAERVSLSWPGAFQRTVPAWTVRPLAAALAALEEFTAGKRGTISIAVTKR